MMHTKLAGHLPLQDMISNIIDGARAKIAAAEEPPKDEKKDKKPNPFFAKSDKKDSKKDEKDEGEEKKASIIDHSDPEQIEKLASALEKVADSIELGGESSQGGMVLATMSPTGGKQSYKKDGSKKHQVPMNTGLAKAEVGAATQVPNDHAKAPGGSPYPKKGVFKTASESVMAKIQAATKSDPELVETEEDEEKVAASDEKNLNMAAGHRRVGAGLGAATGAMAGVNARNVLKHVGGHAMGKGRTAALIAGGTALGAGTGYVGGHLRHAIAKSVAPKEKKSSAEDSPVDFILGKMAESTQGGLVLTDDLPANKGTPPSLPGKDMIQSNEAATNATKAKAKAPQKALLSQVLTEPAQTKSTDSKVHENLRNASKGGVKIAAAKALLQKIAAEGCQCDGKGECKYCKMKAAKGKMEKDSNAAGGMTGASMPGMPSAPKPA
jgi:hypothetical protein